MSAKLTNTFGNITYSDELLSNMAGIATMECYGVVGMASRRAMDGIVELLKGENLSKGVKVNADGQIITIDLFVVLEYGISLSAVATNIMDTVKYRVETMTGLEVKKINVTISDIRI
jgi:uncharacterized alkaline shock family protein YloU